ncbi:hypothetical protein Microterr_09910 [Microbacterium terricola]|uniref:SipW-cognate class signal peptide n=1 Tax=Microbacterium terricola TaxID=344163 RepID=A0ABM8DXN7_9MICO|nr:hypothetical protein Microterr_09910 [Microbacterium terricola]
MLGVVLAVVGAASAWWISSQVALSGVAITYDSRPLVCDGAEVGQIATWSDAEFYEPVVVLTPGMQCRLRVHVLNNSGSTISVDSVTLAMMGDDNALGVEPLMVNPNGQTASFDEVGGVTFTMFSPVHVAAGEDQLLEALIDYHGGARYEQCSAGGLNIPDVSVSVNGVSATKSPAEWNTIWFQQGSLADCEPPS